MQISRTDERGKMNVCSRLLQCLGRHNEMKSKEGREDEDEDQEEDQEEDVDEGDDKNVGLAAHLRESGACAARAAHTDFIVPLQSPGVVCRNSRIVGYQTVLAPLRPQRQSQSACKSVHIGTPNAPARWAAMVSTEITRSISSIRVPVLSIVSQSVAATAPPAISRTSFCKENSRAPDTSASCSMRRNGTFRRVSQSPASQVSPIRSSPSGGSPPSAGRGHLR